MPTFAIEQYEIHVQKYRVEAKDEAEAISLLFDGAAEAIDDSLEFVQVADDLGLPAEDNPEIVDGLRSLGVQIGEHVIPSIRSVEAVG